MTTHNLRPLGHFLGLGILAFATFATIRIWNAGLPFEALFNLAVCLNMWRSAIKAKDNEDNR